MTSMKNHAHDIINMCRCTDGRLVQYCTPNESTRVGEACRLHDKESQAVPTSPATCSCSLGRIQAKLRQHCTHISTPRPQPHLVNTSPLPRRLPQQPGQHPCVQGGNSSSQLPARCHACAAAPPSCAPQLRQPHACEADQRPPPHLRGGMLPIACFPQQACWQVPAPSGPATSSASARAATRAASADNRPIGQGVPHLDRRGADQPAGSCSTQHTGAAAPTRSCWILVCKEAGGAPR